MDDLDRKILSLLAKNARMPVKEIAEQVALTSPAVSSRIHKLETDGIISGYTVVLNRPADRVYVDALISLSVTPSHRDELVELMLDTVCSTKSSIRVAGEELPAEVVRSRLLKLTGAHLLYVLDRVRENTTDVRHVRQYLLTALYNAPLTMDNHYALMVGHDLSGGSG